MTGADGPTSSAEHAMDGAADVSPEAARSLLVDLVSIPSPSGDEREVAERLAAFFDDHDREVWLDDVGNVRAPADDCVLFTSHVDTVPGEIPVRVESAPGGEDFDDEASDDEASDDEAPDDEDREAADPGDEVLWGRGSVDATGPLAAMAVGAVKTGVSFVGVVGEETDSRGARHLVTDRDPPDALVNGEPSGTNGITLGYRGLVAGTYRSETESRHTSRPERNAIQHAIGWWGRVEEAFDDPDSESVFESVTAKPIAVSGGSTADGLGVESVLEFSLRVPPSLTPEAVRERTESIVDSGSIEWSDAIAPVMETPRSDLARAFRAAIRGEGLEPRLLRKTGTSDMNVYAAHWDCSMVTYGPGNSALDHAPDERLSLTGFDRSIAVLERVGERLSKRAED